MRNGLFSTTAIAGLVATLAAAPSPANAFQSQVALAYGPQVTSTNGNISPTPLDIPKFNLAGSTLQSVVVVEDLTGVYHGKATATAVSATITVTMTTGLKISGGLGTPAVLTGDPALMLTAKVPVVATLAGASFTTSSTPKAKRMTYAPASSWTGTGDIDITVGPSMSLVASSPSISFDVNASPSLIFSLGITYNYDPPPPSTPAPEPASLLMLGSGVIALGAAAQRRRRKRRG